MSEPAESKEASASGGKAKTLSEVSQRTYSEQAIFFLNAMWDEHGEQAEEVWNYAATLVSLDDRGAAGNEVDEMKSHRFLEKFGETMTVLELRKQMREIDHDGNKHMALIEYLVFHFKVDIETMLKRPQGTNEDLKAARRALKAVQDEIASIETKKKELGERGSGSGVSAMRARMELEQLLVQDQTGLNRALVTAEAAVRKATREGNVHGMGASWWLKRQLEEAKKYKPSGGLKHKF